MNRPIEILRQTLDKMPNFFYSQEFYAKLRETKIPEKVLANGTATEFLKKHAIQQGFKSRTWEKKYAIKPTPADIAPPSPAIPFETPAPEPKQLTEAEAIEFLKERGYKIFKYQEI